MSALHEAAQLALEALEYGQHSLKQISEYQWESRGQLAMDALKAALAQPEPAQEPVATQQSEALRLADELDGMTINDFYEALGDEAAAELRRLHEQNQRFYAQHASVVSDYEKAVVALKAQRDALLEALHAMLSHTAMLDPSQGFDGFDHSAVNQARAAIKAVEEGE